ncbi:MAG: hypothetical protein EBY41_02080 [Proteobacteria bacterium]|nr:hypothetical protein [Pseudomonadota bacterium]
MGTETDNKIIFLTEFLDQRVRKQSELKYYEKQLEELNKKIFFLKKEIDLTNIIIDIVQKETVIDFREYLLQKEEETKLITHLDEDSDE